jgi:hypothetical protein
MNVITHYKSISRYSSYYCASPRYYHVIDIYSNNVIVDNTKINSDFILNNDEYNVIGYGMQLYRDDHLYLSELEKFVLK